MGRESSLLSNRLILSKKTPDPLPPPATLKAVFSWGLRRQPPLYTVHPFASLRRVDPGDQTIEKYVARNDLSLVVQACTEPFWVTALAFLYAIFCRGGEMRALLWEDVHFRDGYAFS